MTKEIKINYKNEDITIVWQPDLCVHAGVCVATLPEVYDPQAKPWLKIENAPTEALMNQVESCPSGALTYFKNEKA